MVTSGPTAGVEPSGCLNDSGAVSVIANTGLVILIDEGRRGTFIGQEEKYSTQGLSVDQQSVGPFLEKRIIQSRSLLLKKEKAYREACKPFKNGRDERI